MKSRFPNPYSLTALLVLFLLMVQARLWAPYWDTHNVQAILTWDAMGYYLYLPARFIYHDLAHLQFIPDIMREYGPSGSFYQAAPVPGAAVEAPLVMKYTCGLAVLWVPFFWLGHWAAGWARLPAGRVFGPLSDCHCLRRAGVCAAGPGLVAAGAAALFFRCSDYAGFGHHRAGV